MIHPKKSNGNLEYELKQSLGAAIGSCGDLEAGRAAAAAVLRSVAPEDWSAVVEKKLTIQVPTDDIDAASGTTQVEETWKNQKTFNFFDWTKPDRASGIIDVGGNAQTPGGVLGAPMCIAGVGFHMSGEQECLMVPGISVTAEDLALNAALSPDAFTQADLASPANNSGAVGTSAVKAFFDYGVCSWQFCEDLIKAENFVWRLTGMRTLLDVPADEIASCGPPRGRRGLGRNDVPTAQYVARMRAVYAALPGFSTRTFIPQNAVRDGVDPVAPNISTYVPSTAGQSASVSFGEERTGSRLYTNECQRWFGNTMMLREGLPLQFFLEQNDSEEFLDRALEDLGSTFNGQMTTVDGGITFRYGGPNARFNEWNSRAAVPDTLAQQTPTSVMIYKYGFVRMDVCLYGMLLIDEQLASMVSGIMMKPLSGAGADNNVWTGFLGGKNLGGVCDIGEGKPLPGERL